MPVDERKVEPQTTEDKYAKQSFTFRRMKTWQIVAIVVALLLLIIWGAALVS